MPRPPRQPWHRDDLPGWAWVFLALARLAALIGVMLPFALIAAAWWWWVHPPDPAMELLAHADPPARIERVAAPELGERVERWRIGTARGGVVRALWRAAPAAPPPTGPAASAAPVPRAWTVVLLGGIGTDDRAALLVPDSLPVNVLAVSWPWTGPRRMSAFEFVLHTRALRRALLDTPGAIAAGVWAVRRELPGARVALLGASLGVPPTAAALRLARCEAMVLVDGAADLEALLRSEVHRAVGGGAAGAVLAPPASQLAARLLGSLEPMRHAIAARRTPVLLVDAEREERYPSVCVERLRATYPHATRATHPGEHLRPEHAEQVASIVGTAWRWLAALPDSAKGEAP